MSQDSSYLRPGAARGAVLPPGGGVFRADRPLLDLGRGPALARDEKPPARSGGGIVPSMERPDTDIRRSW